MIAATMRFLLQNSIMIAVIPPDLLSAATVTALLVQTSTSATVATTTLLNHASILKFHSFVYLCTDWSSQIPFCISTWNEML